MDTKMKAWRYWRRYAIRPLLWLWCIGACLTTIILFELAWKSNNGWALVFILVAWGIYAVADALKTGRVTINNYIYNGDDLQRTSGDK